MKAFIIAVIILAVIVSFSIILTSLSINASDSLSDAMDKVYAADGDYRSAASAELYSLWRKKRGLFSLSVKKSGIEEIDSCLSTLRELTLHPHSDSDFFTLCQRANEALGVLRNCTSLTLYGVF